MLRDRQQISIWIFEPRHSVTVRKRAYLSLILTHIRIALERDALAQQPFLRNQDVFHFPSQHRVLCRSKLRSFRNAKHHAMHIEHQRKPIIAHKCEPECVAIESERVPGSAVSRKVTTRVIAASRFQRQLTRNQLPTKEILTTQSQDELFSDSEAGVTSHITAGYLSARSPGLKCSESLLNVTPSERRLKVHKLLRLSGHQVNADHIEPHLRRNFLRQLPHILPRQPPHHLRAYACPRQLRQASYHALFSTSLPQCKAALPTTQSSRDRRAGAQATSAAQPLYNPCVASKNKQHPRPANPSPSAQV